MFHPRRQACLSRSEGECSVGKSLSSHGEACVLIFCKQPTCGCDLTREVNFRACVCEVVRPNGEIESLMPFALLQIPRLSRRQSRGPERQVDSLTCILEPLLEGSRTMFHLFLSTCNVDELVAVAVDVVVVIWVAEHFAVDREVLRMRRRYREDRKGCQWVAGSWIGPSITLPAQEPDVDENPANKIMVDISCKVNHHQRKIILQVCEWGDTQGTEGANSTVGLHAVVFPIRSPPKCRSRG